MRTSESSDPNARLQKQGESTRETVLQHAVCTIDHGFQERDEGNSVCTPEEESLERVGGDSDSDR